MTAAEDLERVRTLVDAALASLETSRRRLDDLNVYPVPDGDTGTNLTSTVRVVAETVAGPEPTDRPGLAHAVARAALMGARGNSGVILSQIVRGVADVLAEATNGVDPQLTARALRGASDAANRAVQRPVEGTMLSVIRELAEEAERRAGSVEPLGELLVALVRHAEEAVARTPEQLDILGEAGVVDAGGAGLVELLRGVAGAVTGTGERVELANMHERRERRLSLVPSMLASCGVVAVVAGEGNRLLFETLAEPAGTIRVVTSGEMGNPSTAELVAAIEELRAEEAIVLPNNPNVLLAADHAATEAGRPAVVVPTESIPAGLAALRACDGTRAAAENAPAMAAAAAAVATGEITRASGDVSLNGLAVRRGEWLGLVNGEPVAGGEAIADVASSVVAFLLAEPRAVVTLLTGEEPPPLDGLLEHLALTHPELEIKVHEGGQPHYPLLLGAE